MDNQDLWLTGSQYESSAALNCHGESFSSIIGLGSPIYAFAVTDVKGKNGCSLWWLTNYVVFEASPNPMCNGNTHLAHEIGHACVLTHALDSDNNLMYKACTTAGPVTSFPVFKSCLSAVRKCNLFLRYEF